MRKEGENDVEVVICDVKLANLETLTKWNQYSLYENSDVRTDLDQRQLYALTLILKVLTVCPNLCTKFMIKERTEHQI